MRHNSNQSEIHPFPEGYPQEGLLEGRNALQEALRSGRTIDKVWVAAGDTDRNLARLTSEAKEQGAVVIPVDRRKLDNMSITHAHQGVIAWPPPALRHPGRHICPGRVPGGRLPLLWSVTSCLTLTIWGPSSVPPNAPEPTGW